MDELVKVNFDTQTVSARDLYDLLSKEDGVKGTERFSKWFERYSGYGFVQGIDFSTPNKKVRVQIEGTREVQREVDDIDISVDMAKQICMCADATENPIVAIPTIISLLLLYAGSRIEGGWQDAEEIVEDHNYYVDGDDTDYGINYITYDSNGTERYMDFK